MRFPPPRRPVRLLLSSLASTLTAGTAKRRGLILVISFSQLSRDTAMKASRAQPAQHTSPSGAWLGSALHSCFHLMRTPTFSSVVQSAVKPPNTNAHRPPSPPVTPQQTLAGARHGVYPKAVHEEPPQPAPSGACHGVRGQPMHSGRGRLEQMDVLFAPFVVACRALPVPFRARYWR